jgi:hypothetical protein
MSVPITDIVDALRVLHDGAINARFLGKENKALLLQQQVERMLQIERALPPLRDTTIATVTNPTLRAKLKKVIDYLDFVPAVNATLREWEQYIRAIRVAIVKVTELDRAYGVARRQKQNKEKAR